MLGLNEALNQVVRVNSVMHEHMLKDKNCHILGSKLDLEIESKMKKQSKNSDRENTNIYF